MIFGCNATRASEPGHVLLTEAAIKMTFGRRRAWGELTACSLPGQIIIESLGAWPYVSFLEKVPMNPEPMKL